MLGLTPGLRVLWHCVSRVFELIIKETVRKWPLSELDTKRNYSNVKVCKFMEEFLAVFKTRTRLILALTFQRDWKTELLLARYCRRSAHLRTTVTIYVGTFGTTSMKIGHFTLKRRNVCSRGRFDYDFLLKLMAWPRKETGWVWHYPEPIFLDKLRHEMTSHLVRNLT